MNKFLSTITILIVFTNTALAQSVSLNPGWHLKGTQIAYTDMTDFNKSCIKYVWKYNTSSSSWSIFSPDSNIINDLTTKHVSISPLNSLDANDGFWLDLNASCSIEMQDTNESQTIQVSKGWQLNGTNIGFSSMNNFNKPYIDIVWAYYESLWSAYSPDLSVAALLNANSMYENLTAITPNDGFWLRANSIGEIFNENAQYLSVTDGNFSTISKKSTDNIDDIWNLSFKVDVQNVSDLKIGVLITKANTAFGQIVYDGLSINNSILTSPTSLTIYGENSSAVPGEINYDSSWNTNTIKEDSISLNGNILTLKLAEIMRHQTVVSTSSFTQQTSYAVQIVINNMNILNSKQLIMGDFTYPYIITYPFLDVSNSAIEGTIIIE